MITAIKNNKSTVGQTSYINKINAQCNTGKIAFKSYDDSDGFSKKEINYKRLANIIAQEIPIKKISRIYEDMLDDPDQSFLEKIITTKAKISRKIHHKFSPELVEENMLNGFVQTIGYMVPDSFKVDRDDESFDLPYSTNESIINILDDVDNYSDFFDAMDKYFDHMKRFGYDQTSVLPIVTTVKSNENYITLQYDRKLVKQNK